MSSANLFKIITYSILLVGLIQFIFAAYISDTEVIELGTTIYKEIFDYTPNYILIKGTEYPNGTITQDTYVLTNYTAVLVKKEKVGFEPNGIINISGKIIGGEDSFCMVVGTEVCCYSNAEGGRYAATWRGDGSVDQECIDISTLEQTELISTTGQRFIG